MIFTGSDQALLIRHQNELLLIEAWGRDSLRVRATLYTDFTNRNWALSEAPCTCGNVSIQINEDTASIQNGRIKAFVNPAGVLSFFRDGELFLREYYRNYFGTESRESRCLKLIGRDYKPIIGGDYTLTAL